MGLGIRVGAVPGHAWPRTLKPFPCAGAEGSSVAILRPNALAFLHANWFFILFGLCWGYVCGQQLGDRASPVVRLLCVFGGGVFGIAGPLAADIHTGPKAALFSGLAVAAVDRQRLVRPSIKQFLREVRQGSCIKASEVWPYRNGRRSALPLMQRRLCD